MRERFGAKDPKSRMLRFHTQTGGSTLTAQQPELNVVRTAYQALAAVLGGTQSLHTNAQDEALGLPTEETARLALRTQQVLAYETGVADAIDPLAGSYYLEHLCDEIEREVDAMLDQIDAMGGAVAALQAGYVHEEIERSAFEQQKRIESGESVVVGVNRFQEGSALEPRIQVTPPGLEEERQATLRNFREKRDGVATRTALDALRDAAEREDVELYPCIRDALAAHATLGETCDVLRSTWGVYEG